MAQALVGALEELVLIAISDDRTHDLTRLRPRGSCTRRWSRGPDSWGRRYGAARRGPRRTSARPAAPGPCTAPGGYRLRGALRRRLLPRPAAGRDVIVFCVGLAIAVATVSLQKGDGIILPRRLHRVDGLGRRQRRGVRVAGRRRREELEAEGGAREPQGRWRGRGWPH